MSAHFERYRDDAGGYRYRLRSGNGEIVIPNEGFTREDDVIRGIEQMLDAVDEAAPPPARIIKITDADDGLSDADPEPDIDQPTNDDEVAPEEA